MQQAVNLNLVLDQVAKDKGIERATLIAILEDAIAQAAKKHFGPERALKAQYDEDKGQINLFQVLTIVSEPTEENPLADPVNMVPVATAQAKGIEVEVGDELDFPIYYRPE
ncbi:MAG: NusA N-terminal domain-containing protein, partial [Anaeromyxobacteraceae bacterium]